MNLKRMIVATRFRISLGDGFLYFLLLALNAVSVITLSAVQSAVLFLLVGLTLGVLARSARHLLSPVHLIIAAYLLGFPLLVLVPDFSSYLMSGLSRESLNFGMLWATRGFGAFAVGYATVTVLKRGSNLNALQVRDQSLGRARHNFFIFECLGLLGLIGWVASVATLGTSFVFIERIVDHNSGSGTVLQIVTLLASFRLVYFFGLLLFNKAITMSLSSKILAASIFLTYLTDVAVIGSKGTIVRFVAVVVLAIAISARRFSVKIWFSIALGLIAVFLSFAVITEYRVIMRSALSAGHNVSDFDVQIGAFQSAFVNSVSSDENLPSETLDSAISRFGSGIGSFSNLLDHTGRHSPFENSWANFLIPIYSIAPRALFPEKALFFGSGTNASRYYGWKYGGISVTLLGSFYYAWGYFGILMGMFFMGGLLAYIIKRVTVPPLGHPYGKVLLVTLILPLLDVGVEFQAVTMSFVRTGLVLLGIHWFLRMFYNRIFKIASTRSAPSMIPLRYE